MIPVPNKRAEIVPVTVGPNFSTKRPMKAADIPKKKIAKLKANEILVHDKTVC